MSKPKKAKMGAARLHAYAEQLQAHYEKVARQHGIELTKPEVEK